MKKNKKINSLHTKDLEEYIRNNDLNVPIYIQCAFNRYKIKSLIDAKDFIVLDVGDVENECS